MRDKVTQTEQNKQMSEGREGGRVYVYVCVFFKREKERRDRDEISSLCINRL